MSGIFSAGGAGAVGASGSFYPVTIDDSLRFEDGSSAYLNRTPSSAGNRKTWTFSCWLKGAYFAGSGTIFSTSQNYDSIRYTSDGEFIILLGNGSANLNTTAVFRDPSAWYSLVISVDTTQSTSTNRVKFYVNGSQITSFSTSTYPSLNYDTGFNHTSYSNAIGRRQSTSNLYYDGYMAEVNFIDGQALDATSFGEAKDGVWIPKSYSGSYGTNGFRLEFDSDTTDSSGNGNDWTANNISAHDYVPDSPTNNFAVMNPLDKDASWTLSEGNLKVSLAGTAGDDENIASTMAVPNSELIYFEAKPNNNFYGCVGIAKFGFAESNPFGGNVGSTFLYLGGGSNAKVYVDGSVSFDTGATWSLDIIGVAVDMSNSKVWFSKNGTYLGSGTQNPETNTGGFSISPDEVMPYAFKGNSNVTQSFTFNFGQDSTFAGATTSGGNQDDNGIGDFKYAPPSGYLALCTANLPTPTIVDGSEYFNTVLYTGTGATQSITGVGFQPDWVWIKERSSTSQHALFDVVRGVQKRLVSDSTAAEDTSAQLLTAFNSDGFSVGTDGAINENTQTYASWNWKAGGTAVSNTDGTITSQVSANVDAGFSIVSYVGNNATGATVGHGLTAAAPEMIIIKDRDTAGYNWHVYHAALGATKEIKLNSTSAAVTAAFWNNTAPTSSVFTVNGGGWEVNTNTKNHIAYCFHSSDVCKVGSYTGNDSNDGTFVYTGFRPAWVMIKSATSAGDSWFILDSKRTTTNVMGDYFRVESSNAEATFTALDLLSNGFKLRTTSGAFNDATTFVYLAFAENPFKYANAR